MINNKPNDNFNWETEFDKLVEQLRKPFSTNKIQEFLQIHIRLNQLFTSKLQAHLDKKGHTIMEYKIDSNPVLMDKIDLFNERLNSFLALEDKKNQEAKKPEEPKDPKK